jgi:hypothetical protein
MNILIVLKVPKITLRLCDLFEVLQRSRKAVILPVMVYNSKKID